MIKNNLFNYSFAFAVLFFILNIGALTGVGVANAIEKFFFLLVGLILIFRKHNNDVTLFFFIAFAITLISAFLSQNPDFSWVIYLKAFSQVMVIYFLLAGKLRVDEKNFILKFIAWLPLIMLGLSLLYSIAGVRNMFSWEYASGLPRLQLTLIPAFVGGICIASVYAALKCADKFGHQYLWLVVVSVLILLLTSARMPLFITTILSAYVFFSGFRGQKNLKWLIIFSSVFFLLLIIVVAGDIILGRLTQTHLSGREIIWDHLEQVSNLFPNFGVGYGHQIYFMPHEVTVLTGGTIGAHNEYLRLHVELGFIPNILFFLTLAITVFLISRNKNYSNPPEILLAGFLYFLFSSFDNTISSPSLFLFLVVVVLTNSNTVHQPTSKTSGF